MIYDLTQLAYDDMSLFPETPPPSFTPIATVEQEGWHETMLHLTSHTGTHMDAPAHMIAGGATLDTMDVSRFMGRALVLDVSALRGAAVTRELLEGIVSVVSSIGKRNPVSAFNTAPDGIHIS